MSGMTPQEIVHELDKYIVGQARAKRVVAIALRNRWRRQRLRNATATAFLASVWPMMWRLSSWTISRGVMDMMYGILKHSDQCGKVPLRAGRQNN